MSPQYLVERDIEADFIGKTALKHIRDIRSVTQAQDGQQVGKVTSAVYPPRPEKNISLAMVDINYAALGTRFYVEKPFFDPNNKVTAT
ncbi:MAG: glycine cleavage system aminomethyltransferase T [Motiliproteus sp.]|jgi:glycine cleavage system aminomethyltransferase T